MALEAPERIDALLAERAAQPVADRLHVLAGEEKLGELPVHAAGAAERLLDALRRRYNFIVVDVPFAPVPLYRDLLDLAHQRVLVMEPTLAGGARHAAAAGAAARRRQAPARRARAESRRHPRRPDAGGRWKTR